MILLANRFTAGLIDITEPTKHDKRVQKLMVLDRMIRNNTSGFVDIALFDPNAVLLTISSESEPYKFLYKNPNHLLQNSPLFIQNFPLFTQKSPSFIQNSPLFIQNSPLFTQISPLFIQKSLLFQTQSYLSWIFPFSQLLSAISNYSQTSHNRPPKMSSQDDRLWEMIAYKS